MKHSVLHTDSAQTYMRIGRKFQDHQFVNHTMGEYIRSGVTTNHLEGFFSQIRRSVDGTFDAVSDVHLPRYLAEFDYRYSTRKASDAERMNQLMERSAGTRLTYAELIGA